MRNQIDTGQKLILDKIIPSDNETEFDKDTVAVGDSNNATRS
jgi:hypothetical protein